MNIGGDTLTPRGGVVQQPDMSALVLEQDSTEAPLAADQAVGVSKARFFLRSTKTLNLALVLLLLVVVAIVTILIYRNNNSQKDTQVNSARSQFSATKISLKDLLNGIDLKPLG